MLKDHSKREGADCLLLFVRTQNALLSSSQSLNYPLNPHLSIASEHIYLGRVINLFSVWLVGFQGKRHKLFVIYESGFLFDPGFKFPISICYNSVFKSIEEAPNKLHGHFDVFKAPCSLTKFIRLFDKYPVTLFVYKATTNSISAPRLRTLV